MHLPAILIKTVSHKDQQYETCGNWRFLEVDGRRALLIEVSEMSDWRYEFLVALHELTEVFICQFQGIHENEVTRFDKRFENRRKPGNTDEPGDDPKAPYRVAHCIATGVERVVAAVIGVSWKKYEEEINSL